MNDWRTRRSFLSPGGYRKKYAWAPPKDQTCSGGGVRAAVSD